MPFVRSSTSILFSIRSLSCTVVRARGPDAWHPPPPATAAAAMLAVGDRRRSAAASARSVPSASTRSVLDHHRATVHRSAGRLPARRRCHARRRSMRPRLVPARLERPRQASPGLPPGARSKLRCGPSGGVAVSPAATRCSRSSSVRAHQQRPRRKRSTSSSACRSSVEPCATRPLKTVRTCRSCRRPRQCPALHQRVEQISISCPSPTAVLAGQAGEVPGIRHPLPWQRLTDTPEGKDFMMQIRVMGSTSTTTAGVVGLDRTGAVVERRRYGRRASGLPPKSCLHASSRWRRAAVHIILGARWQAKGTKYV